MAHDYVPIKAITSLAKRAAEDLRCVKGAEDNNFFLVMWQKRDDSNQYFYCNIRLFSSLSHCAIISRNPLTHSIELASTGKIRVDEAKRS